LIEKRGDKDEPLSFKAETADGQELVDKINVRIDGNVISSRSSGDKQIDLDFAHLTCSIFPTAPPKVEEPTKAKVFVFTLSGNLRRTRTATLRFQFGRAPRQQELTFDNLPMP